MLPENFKADPEEVCWLTWPSGSYQKIHYVEFASYAEPELEEEVIDAMHFFSFEDRSARLVIGRVERDTADEFAFSVRTLPGRDEIGVVTVTRAAEE